MFLLCVFYSKDTRQRPGQSGQKKVRIEYKEGRNKNPGGVDIFRTRPDQPWGPPSLLYNGYRVFFPGVKRPRLGVNHPPQFSAEVKERVELYLYSSSRPSLPVLGRNFTFTVVRFPSVHPLVSFRTRLLSTFGMQVTSFIRCYRQ
jgi:hypothetical protein